LGEADASLQAEKAHKSFSRLGWTVTPAALFEIRQGSSPPYEIHPMRYTHKAILDKPKPAKKRKKKLKLKRHVHNSSQD
jgi:hypothetical protein